MASTEAFNLIEKLSITFGDNDKFSTVCEEIASDIEVGEIKLFNVIEKLGEFLTNKDASIRENGVRSLSTVLSNISENFLNEQELQLLTSFYCDRLNDHHSIISAIISGILAIVQMNNLPKDAPIKLLHTIFRDVRCQSELQETRRNIYLILNTLLSSRSDDLKLMGPDFIYGVISSMDGESDPRNLILLFNFLPQFIKEFNLHHLTEEMFEVIACYFPVDFNSSPKEENEITRENLANALELCLSAIPQFAQYCLPLIIEKLDTNLKRAKMDSLQLLAHCSIIFGVQGLKDHLDELWPLLRREVIPGIDEELKENALKAITAMIKAITKDENILVTFIEKIIGDTRPSLCNIQMSLYRQSEKLMETVAKASDKACHQVLKTIVALCLAQYTTNISKMDRIGLIETLNNFMTIYTDFGLNISNISELSWTDLTLLYLNELTSIKNEHVLRAKLIDGLAIQKESLTRSHREILYNEICDEIDGGNSNTRYSCQIALIIFAESYPNEIFDIITERLTSNNVETSIMKYRIEAFAIIGKIPDIGSKTLTILVKLIICNIPEITFASLNSINKLLLQKSKYNIHHFLYYNCNIIDKILQLNLKQEYDDDEFYEIRHIASNICQSIIRKSTADQQQNIIVKYLFTLRSDTAKNILLWEGFITPFLPCNVTHEIIDLFMIFMEISLYNINENTRLSSCRLAAVIINKMEYNDTLDEYLNIVQKRIVSILNDDDENMEVKHAAIVFHTWITKGLITRGNQNSQFFLDYQLNLLRNRLIGKFVGVNFRIFVDKKDDTLTENNFCIIKIFYKQRLFQNIINEDAAFTDFSRHNYLIALIHLVEELPMELLYMNLLKLVPLLIESLSLDNGRLILSTLKILRLLLDTKNDIFVEQIHCFISRCLNLSMHPKMDVRIAALNCLNSYCNYSTVLIKPYKDDILQKLSTAIDDRKRLVRQMAATTRIRWYLVGAPGTPE